MRAGLRHIIDGAAARRRLLSLPPYGIHAARSHGEAMPAAIAQRAPHRHDDGLLQPADASPAECSPEREGWRHFLALAVRKAAILLS